MPERIEQLLTASINPMLASHGGFAPLVGVDGHTAYVTMGGGCQGCSMSQATLTEGIQRAIVEGPAGDHRGRRCHRPLAGEIPSTPDAPA
ncbi:MAG: hypothetical protein Ct9H300mP12_13100 [Acidimicrobiales bacterium]|nr:MAG: hypothetical protein Ct9H300mP12_13100 [Acidimicrobiales bacterium]